MSRVPLICLLGQKIKIRICSSVFVQLWKLNNEKLWLVEFNVMACNAWINIQSVICLISSMYFNMYFEVEDNIIYNWLFSLRLTLKNRFVLVSLT